MSNKKNMWLWIALVVIVVIAIIIWMQKSGTSQQSANTQGQEMAAASPTPTATPTPTSVNKSASGIAYEAAIARYKFRFQFSTCHNATPQSIALSQNSQVMIDNRDAAAHTFVVDGKQYRVSGLNFVIVTASKLGNLPITCDGANSVTLNVEK